MPRGHVVTRSDYEALLHAFHECPGNLTGASRATGMHRKTCRRGWEIGWPERGWPACKQVIADEQAEVRARLEEVAERERRASERERRLRTTDQGEKARLDAMARREQWAESCKGARANAQLMLVTINQLLKAAQAKAGIVREGLAQADLSPLTWVKLMRDLVAAGRQVGEALHLTLQTEHLALGQPTAILGVGPVEIPLDQAEAEIQAAHAALARARARRALPPAAGVGREGMGESGRSDESPFSDASDAGFCPSEKMSDAPKPRTNRATDLASFVRDAGGVPVVERGAHARPEVMPEAPAEVYEPEGDGEVIDAEVVEGGKGEVG